MPVYLFQVSNLTTKNVQAYEQGKLSSVAMSWTALVIDHS
jgi:hypothetical protein